MISRRCGWVNLDDPLYVRYHDEEWGVPLRGNDTALFERLCLEGAQAGLSWITILRKREAYRAAYDGFDPAKVALYDEAKQAALLANAGIVRNRAKIRASVQNAQAFLRVQEAFGSFDAYLWAFVDGAPIQNRWATLGDVPAQTPLSQKISKDLRARGFNFVGPTICYAMMQATGMVNDHTLDCFRHEAVAKL
jgi:DNA-3-methyladenine glycosylase I